MSVSLRFFLKKELLDKKFNKLNLCIYTILYNKMGKRKASDNAGRPNQDLCDFLMELANYERNLSRNIYKYNAYRKAASTLSTLSERVKSGQEARKLPGIGEKIAKKIDEFLNTGKLQKLEDINKDESNVAINLLTRVSGIGPTKAKELVNSGIKTLNDLKKHQEKLNHHQKIGLKYRIIRCIILIISSHNNHKFLFRYFEDFEKRIPRKEIEQIEKIIKDSIIKLNKEYIITICGSYRRGKEESGDIDVLLTHPTYTSKEKESKKKTPLKDVVECLEKRKLIVNTISLGQTKFMGVCQIPSNDKKPFRRLDIRLAPYDQYYCTVLYFTGNDLFNKSMRAHALEKNYTLNEYTLKRLTPEGTPGEAEKISCEEDIFRILKLPYKEPKDRNS